ncbi:DUF1800 domain-containing protein [Deinococcus koreensis]|uniref:DUF1800 domain-containing protein n=1 Tax=Deinococcus koreensis TaxID=2054903 RepID=A0A2K3UXS5_9DEIO|nr:DUF1800 domain-containing protein [Deinococcus koreensis]PNY81343.1 hypothetical protein CVO96_08055 [Deinococcus koreensis]
MSGERVGRRTVLKAGVLATVPAVLARAESAPPAPAKAAAPAFSRPPLGVIVLSRLGFGSTPDDLQAFRKLGADDAARLTRWLDAQLSPGELDDRGCEERLGGLDSLKESLPDLWKTYYRGAPEGERKYEVIWQPTVETRLAVLTRMVYSRRQLHEVVTGFWRDHFNVHPDKDERIPALLPHYDATLRRHALGSFRTLLGAVAHHPVMLYYLDNASSTRAGPNENYARELFELHTLGAEHYRGVGRQSAVPRVGGVPGGYVDDDVYEATRVLTGWRTADDPDSTFGDGGGFAFDPQGHDRFQKTVLGHYFPPNGGEQEGEVLLDLLAAHPGTARHVALKLARRLITETPPPELVEGAAQVFLKARKAPDQLAQVVRFLAASDAFRTSWGERLRRPLDALAATMRVLGSDLQARPGEFWPPGWLGQEVYDWRPPNGAPDRRAAWSGSGHLLRRWTMARALSGNWWKEVRSDVPGATPPHLKTPLELADHWAVRVLGQPLPPGSRAVVARQLAAGGEITAPLSPEQIRERLPDAVAFVLMTPEALVS